MAICFPKQILYFLGLVDFPISDLTPYTFLETKNFWFEKSFIVEVESLTKLLLFYKFDRQNNGKC
jgi:hypothetical protein